MTIQNQNGITSVIKFKNSLLPKTRVRHYGLGFLILSASSSISSILFYSHLPDLSKIYARLNTRFHADGETPTRNPSVINRVL